MNTELIVFLILAVVAVGTALGLLLNRNAVYAALFLVLNFTTVAVFYLMLGAPFIALAQVTVYAGAIMVLFLFVIMLLAAERLVGTRQTLAWQWRYPLTLGILLFGLVGYLLLQGKLTSNVTLPDAAANNSEALKSMSLMLFNQYLLPFEITSILLLTAMIGAIVLTKHEKGGRG